jgi:hypothetical protein
MSRIRSLTEARPARSRVRAATAEARAEPIRGSARERNFSSRSASLTGLAGCPGKWTVVSDSARPEWVRSSTVTGFAAGQ